jgi:ABC-type Mn2+/Zn2+ transport system permease subunit
VGRCRIGALDSIRLIDHLSDPAMRGIYVPGLVAGLCTALTCALVSPLVVVRRLGFIGQGISHCAFGGVGVAAVLAAWGLMGTGGVMEFVVVSAFCIAAALGMGMIADRRRTPEDSTIGMFLVGSMALGALLVTMARDHRVNAGLAPDPRSWESILFGSVMNAGHIEMWLAIGVLAAVLIVLGMLRRALLFWAFDEEAARAFGVPSGAMRAILMIVLALIVVTAMRTAGVVLASALLVLPGATALRLSDRLGTVVLVSLACGVIGLVGGMILSVQANWQPGPCVVLVMAALFVASLASSKAIRPAAAPE